MFMVTGTCVNIWMLSEGLGHHPDFGHSFYVDNLNNNYVNDEEKYYEDGNPI